MGDSTCMISCRRTGDFRFIGQALSAPKNNHDLSQNNESVNTYSFAKLKNVGNGTSVNIIYSWNGNTECFPINAVMQGDSYFFQFTFHISENGYTRHLLEWEYQDLLGNSYTQKVYFNFKDGDLLDYENDTPVFKGKIKYVWDNEK